MIEKCKGWCVCCRFREYLIVYLSRHLFAGRPGRALAMRDHLMVPCVLTWSVNFASSESVHGFLGSSDRCLTFRGIFVCVDMVSHLWSRSAKGDTVCCWCRENLFVYLSRHLFAGRPGRIFAMRDHLTAPFVLTWFNNFASSESAHGFLASSDRCLTFRGIVCVDVKKNASSE